MKIIDLMSTHVLSLHPDDDLATALETMSWAAARHLPVMIGETLVGVVSEHDLLAALAPKGNRAGGRRPVREIMRTAVETIAPDADADTAAARMTANEIGCLPVVRAGKVIGIVTLTDVLSDRLRQLRPAAAHEAGDAAGAGVLTREIMRLGPAVAHVDDRVLDVAVRMAEHGIRHLPVLDHDRWLVGMLSDRDIRQAIGSPLRLAAAGALPDAVVTLEVKAIMARLPATVHGELPLPELAQLFADRRVEAVPVVGGDGRLIGIVSYVDVLLALAGRRATSTGDDDLDARSVA